MLKKTNIFVHIVILSLACYWSECVQPMARAEDSVWDTIDCTDVSIDFVDDPNLTPEERLRLMDRAFQDSLNKFELCRTLKEMAESSGASAMNGDGTKTDPSKEAGGSPAGESVASPTMSGTQTTKADPSATRVEAAKTEDLKSPRDKAMDQAKTGGNIKQSSGKLPEDIPPAQNDDALAAQIRYAAENEPDPVKSRQLWNEYRKYKGLPIK